MFHKDFPFWQRPSKPVPRSSPRPPDPAGVRDPGWQPDPRYRLAPQRRLSAGCRRERYRSPVSAQPSRRNCGIEFPCANFVLARYGRATASARVRPSLRLRRRRETRRDPDIVDKLGRQLAFSKRLRPARWERPRDTATAIALDRVRSAKAARPSSRTGQWSATIRRRPFGHRHRLRSRICLRIVDGEWVAVRRIPEP